MNTCPGKIIQVEEDPQSNKLNKATNLKERMKTEE